MRTALITGASRGIGLAIAEGFQRQGVRTILPARSELDLASRESVEAYSVSLNSEPVDILINNAGINFPEAFEEISNDHWDATLEVNLNSPRRLLQGVVPGMKSRKWGRVLNISSVFSLVTKKGRTVYSATKAGINSLTRTSAVELAPYGILVNAVLPGYVETAMTHANNSPEELRSIIGTIPIGRLAQPREIAEIVTFLCSESNTYLTGQNIVVDGAFTCQ